jgi:hypothetical protein
MLNNCFVIENSIKSKLKMLEKLKEVASDCINQSLNCNSFEVLLR